MGVHGRGSTNWLRRISKKEKPRLSAEAKPADPTSAMLRHISLIAQRMHRSVWSALCTLTTFSNTQAATGRKLYKPTAAQEQQKNMLCSSPTATADTGMTAAAAVVVAPATSPTCTAATEARASPRAVPAAMPSAAATAADPPQ